MAVERNGRWRTAIEVPGLAALSKGGWAQVYSVSCGSAGSCAVGGTYRGRHDHYQGFVAVERNGRWGTAIEVPGLGALNKGNQAGVSSVSCASAGSCTAVGLYLAGDGNEQGYVAGERNGRWGTAIEIPGLATLDKGSGAQVTSVSCASAGGCTTAGPTAPEAAVTRGSWPASGTAAGARRSRCPARPPEHGRPGTGPVCRVNVSRRPDRDDVTAVCGTGGRSRGSRRRTGAGPPRQGSGHRDPARRSVPCPGRRGAASSRAAPAGAAHAG